MSIRKLIVFTVPAEVDWKAALPPDCQYVVQHYDDASGLVASADFELFVAKVARAMFHDLDFDRAQELKRQEGLRTEGLDRDAALAAIGVPPEKRDSIAATAEAIREAILRGPDWRL